METKQAQEITRYAKIACVLEEQIAERLEWMQHPVNAEAEEQQVYDEVLLQGLYDQIRAKFKLDYSPHPDPDCPFAQEDIMGTLEWVRYLSAEYGEQIHCQYELGRYGRIERLEFDYVRGLLGQTVA